MRAIRPWLVLAILLPFAVPSPVLVASEPAALRPRTLVDTAAPGLPGRVLTYGTYLGWGGRDEIFDMATDATGATYVTGTRDFVYDSNLGFRRDTSTGFVAKILPSGALAWLTTFDGSGTDQGRALAVDSEARVYVVGSTTSSNFPVVDPLQPVRAGTTCGTVVTGISYPCSDAFLLALDPSGAITFATTLGGASNDSASDLAVGEAGQVYVIGSTRSIDFPLVGTTLSTSGEGFVARIDVPRRLLAYATRLPGVNTTPTAIAAAADRLTIVGYSFPGVPTEEVFTTTPGAWQPSFAGASCESFRGAFVGPCGDAFVLVVPSDASRVIFATYLGGSRDDVATSVLMGDDGTVVVAGYTKSLDFPVQSAVQPANASRPPTAWYYNSVDSGEGWDGFVARLDATGTSALFSTYLGWSGDDVIHDIVRTAAGYAVAGVTNSSDAPVLPGTRAPLLGLLRAGADDGRPWTNVSRGLPSFDVGPLAIVRGTPGTMLVSHERRVWRTRDAGSTWRQLATPWESVPGSVGAITLYSVPDSTVFAYVPPTTVGKRSLYRSDDAGDTWMLVSGPVEGVPFYARGAGDGVFFASANVNGNQQLFKTGDGATWIPLANLDLGLQLTTRPGAPDTVFAWGAPGLFRSDDGGQTFIGLGNAGWMIVAGGRTDGNPPPTYALTENDVLESTDDGVTWTSIRQNLTTPLKSLVVDPHTGALFGHEDRRIWTWSPGSSAWRVVQTFDDGFITRLWVDASASTMRLVAAMWGSYSVPQQAFVAELTEAGALETARTIAPVASWHREEGVRLARDAADTLHVGGWTRPDTVVPITANAAQGTRGGDFDAFVVRLADPAANADANANGLPDAWEVQMGLRGASAEAAADPDRDGVTTRDEYAAGTHPNGIVRRSFAEGATGDLFDTLIALANPSDTADAHVLIRFLDSGGIEHPLPVVLGPLTRRDIRVADVPGLERAEFSTIVESDTEVIADRRMTWDEYAYGSHAETAVAGPATTWYLAEGATHSGFDLFYLIANPGDATAGVTVNYLRPAPAAPIEKHYTVAPRSRFTIWVNGEDPGLASAEVSATIAATAPVIVERAMYLDTPGRFWGAGHASVGVTAPATRWFFAEGATGTFFDLFLLIANPGNEAASVNASYSRSWDPLGTPVVKTYTVAPHSRFNIWVDLEDPLLADTAVSTTIESVNGVPIVAERAMWWPGPTAATWYEAHNSAGATATSPMWGIADGEDGGEHDVATYLLVHREPGFTPALVTLLFDDGNRVEHHVQPPYFGRLNISIRDEFPEARGRRFSAVVQGTYSRLTLSPMAPLGGGDLVVERALYGDALGERWSSGANALGTNLMPHLVKLPYDLPAQRGLPGIDTEVPVGARVAFASLAAYHVWTVQSDPANTDPACAQLASVGSLAPGEIRTIGPFLEPTTCAWRVAGDEHTQGRILVR